MGGECGQDGGSLAGVVGDEGPLVVAGLPQDVLQFAWTQARQVGGERRHRTLGAHRAALGGPQAYGVVEVGIRCVRADQRAQGAGLRGRQWIGRHHHDRTDPFGVPYGPQCVQEEGVGQFLAPRSQPRREPASWPC